MPTADDLFRPTAQPEPESQTVAPGTAEARPQETALASESARSTEGHEEEGAGGARSRHRRSTSGRVRHDEKMTVYVTADELLELEHARLTLRRETGLAVDRGRLVREAIAIALADLDANGDQSLLVQRLSQR